MVTEDAARARAAEIVITTSLTVIRMGTTAAIVVARVVRGRDAAEVVIDCIDASTLLPVIDLLEICWRFD